MDGERPSGNQGSNFVLHHVEKRVKEAHAEQSFSTEGHSKCTLSCTRIPTTVYDAWLYIQGSLPFQCTINPARPWNFESLAEDDSALGVTKIDLALPGDYLRYLPQTLQTLSFPTEFKQSLKRVTLPSSLQSLSF